MRFFGVCGVGIRFFLCEIESTFINSLPHSALFLTGSPLTHPPLLRGQRRLVCLSKEAGESCIARRGEKTKKKKKNGGEMRGWQNEAKRERERQREEGWGSDRGEEEEEEEEEREEECVERARVSPSGALARL